MENQHDTVRDRIDFLALSIKNLLAADVGMRAAAASVPESKLPQLHEVLLAESEKWPVVIMPDPPHADDDEGWLAYREAHRLNMERYDHFTMLVRDFAGLKAS